MASYHRTGTGGGVGGSGFSGPVPRRSNSSTVRLPFSASTLAGRPRSLTYSPSSSQTSLNVGGFGVYGSSPTSSLGGYGSLSTYGGTTSGYGGITLHAPSSSSLSLSSSPTGGSYYNSYLVAPGGSGYTRNLSLLPVRTSSFNRQQQSRASPLSSYLGSRSSSLTSLPGSIRSGSEGYASGSEYSGHSSRLSSATGAGNSPQVGRSRAALDADENGEVDYKKLYEQAMEENDRLREKLKKTEETLSIARTQLESASNTPSKNSLSEIEKRERRAMERKLSEMEEELKQLQKLKAENERLKAENRALTRVVSKLTNSANATK